MNIKRRLSKNKVIITERKLTIGMFLMYIIGFLTCYSFFYLK